MGAPWCICFWCSRDARHGLLRHRHPDELTNPLNPLNPPFLSRITRYDFSNNWQLWLNTCLALQQTLSTCLLTLARNRHTAFVERCMCAILREDCEVEYRARALSGHRAMNPPVRIEWAADSRFSRAMDWWVEG